MAITASLIIYIRSYLKVTEALESFISKHGLETGQFLELETWVLILILSILFTLIVLGIALIFAYSQKMRVLLRQQQNFINGLTHELKTPVASMRLFLETFIKHDLPREEQLKYLEMMKRDSDRLNDNIMQILHLARLEEKHFKEKFEIIPVEELLVLMEKSLKSRFPLEIKLNLQEVGSKKLQIKANLQWIELLFSNIANNASTYNKSACPELVITPRGRQHFWIEIHFCDNGVGLEKKQLKNIFKKFYQVDDRGKGTGLGLSLSHMIAKLHRGDLRAESPGPGQGSCFILRLPLLKNKKD